MRQADSRSVPAFNANESMSESISRLNRLIDASDLAIGKIGAGWKTNIVSASPQELVDRHSAGLSGQKCLKTFANAGVGFWGTF